MRFPPVFTRAPRLIAPALCCILLSCAPSTEFYRGVEEQVSAGNYLSALSQVRSSLPSYGDKATVLYKLDMGLLYHYAGQADSSSQWFFAAEREMDELYTKSVSLAAASFLLNDNILPYEGEDFEKALVNVFLALNYAAQGEPDEALVEARKVDLKLRQLSKAYEGKNVYQDDAFIRYLMGALYESRGEINDAFISYRKAHEVYAVYQREYGTPAPSFLLDDLVRTATMLGFADEAGQYRALGGKPFDPRSAGQGSILVVVYAGKGPVKEEYRPSVSIADDNGVIHTFQIALPRFVPRMTAPRTYGVTLSGPEGTWPARTAEVAEDVTAIAAKSLSDRISMVYLKSGGRAVLKFLASEAAKNEIRKKTNDDGVLNFLGSLAVDLAVGATERADVRGWRTLPAQFQVVRMMVPPGTYSLRVAASDGHYVLPADTVRVRSGQTGIVIADDVR
jgi:uncharacterized protein